MTAFSPLPVVIPPEGLVTIEQKARPVCETQPPYPPVAYTRGIFDISAWRDTLKEMADAPIWHEHDHSTPNTVRIARAAHDAWGIHKIIFTFCDDFLLKVIELPRYHDPKWRALILPIFQQMGIEEARVVRCLLARMPAGVEIPVHHDTGYWVQHTHRCHLALETNDLIDFMVGPTPDALQKYSFDEGRIVELNNQAKHSVNNRMLPGQYRTHLIFDYLDASYTSLPRRISIQNGETIFQTRRSIDIGSEVAAYRVHEHQPKFIVIGAQKCGTTSMYEFLCQHPLVARGKRRETHYFDWRYPATIPLTEVSKHRQTYLQFFEHAQLAQHPSICTGESTPSYLLHADIVLPRLLAIVPWASLIIMLRNPVDRAYSQYQMITDTQGTPQQLALRGHSQYRGMSFSQVIDLEVQELRAQGITAESSYADFQTKILVPRQGFQHGGHSVLIRGLYVFQVAAYLAQWPRDRLKIVSMELDLKKDVQKTMREVQSFLGLPPSEVEDAEAKNTRSYTPLDAEVRERLREFYKPYNEKLYALLGRDFQW